MKMKDGKLVPEIDKFYEVRENELIELIHARLTLMRITNKVKEEHYRDDNRAIMLKDLITLLDVVKTEDPLEDSQVRLLLSTYEFDI